MEAEVNYYDVNAMSASAIKRGAISMLHMEEFFTTPNKPTTAMIAGSLRHLAVLEPEKFSKLVAFEGDRRSKEYKLAESIYGKDNLIAKLEYDGHKRAAEMAMSHPVASKYFANLEGTEVEFYWEHGATGNPCKAKIDGVCNDGTIIEFKTTANLDNFASAAARLYYNLQLGWYAYAAHASRVVVIAQESNAPYDVAVMSVRPLDLMQWYKQAEVIALRWWSHGLHKQEVSGRYPEEFAFELPAWAQQQESVDISNDDYFEAVGL
jgi:hypothetical protein